MPFGDVPIDADHLEGSAVGRATDGCVGDEPSHLAAGADDAELGIEQTTPRLQIFLSEGDQAQVVRMDKRQEQLTRRDGAIGFEAIEAELLLAPLLLPSREVVAPGAHATRFERDPQSILALADGWFGTRPARHGRGPLRFRVGHEPSPAQLASR
jgi:hypothetical protein